MCSKRSRNAFEAAERQAERSVCPSIPCSPVGSFAICINNESNPASLILDKVYRVLPDAAVESHNILRVIDEDKSKSDGYLY
jgi:hypothetical protein